MTTEKNQNLKTESNIDDTNFKVKCRSREIKVLNAEAKNLIKSIEDRNKGLIVKMTIDQTDAIKKGYLGTPKPQNYKSSLCYAIARVLHNINPTIYHKVEVGKNKVLLEDVSRVKFLDGGLLGVDFREENKRE